MEIRQLEYFQMVARTGGITGAAGKLNISQPSVTTSIKKLEEELGVQLLDRNSRNVTLTFEGRQFLSSADEILARMADAKRMMEDFHDNPRGILKLGITPVMSVLFPPAFAEYQRKFPHVKMQIEEEGSLSIAAHLEQGNFDLGILITRDLSPRLDYAVVCRGEIFVCLPENHSLAQENIISLEDLKNEHFILFREDTYSRRLIVEKCAEYHFEPQVVFVSSQIGTVNGLVREGMGISFFFADIAEKLEGVVIRPLATPLILETGVAWKKERYLSGAAKELVRILTKAMA